MMRKRRISAPGALLRREGVKRTRGQAGGGGKASPKKSTPVAPRRYGEPTSPGGAALCSGFKYIGSGKIVYRGGGRRLRKVGQTEKKSKT